MLQTFLQWKLHFVALLVGCLSAPLLPAQEGAAPKAPGGQKNADPKLPSDYEAPRTVPPVMTHTEELTTEAEDEKLSSELRSKDKYTIVFNNGELNDETKAIVEKWAKWRLYQMTLKKNRKRLQEVRAALMRDISYAARSKSVPRKEVEAFRRFLCQEVTTRAAELLENNFHVRLNAAIVLANLNLTEYDRRKDIPEQAYVRAGIPLLDVLKTKTGGGVDEQLEAVKVQAAIGLGRIALLGPQSDLNIRVNNENFENHTAKTLIAELKKTDSHPWYQKRLAESLAKIDLVNDVSSGKAIIIEALGEVLADPNRDLCVRARAARALGRAALPSAVNTPKLVFQILLLEHEMAQAYQKDPNAYHWLGCFSDLYFAFHPVSDDEITLYRVKEREAGLNRKDGLGATAEDAYQQLLPIVKHVVSQPGWSIPKDVAVGRQPNEPIPDQLIADLAQWLSQHKPADHKLAPNLPELAPNAPVPMPPKAASTGS